MKIPISTTLSPFPVIKLELELQCRTFSEMPKIMWPSTASSKLPSARRCEEINGLHVHDRKSDKDMDVCVSVGWWTNEATGPSEIAPDMANPIKNVQHGSGLCRISCAVSAQILVLSHGMPTITCAGLGPPTCMSIVKLILDHEEILF